MSHIRLARPPKNDEELHALVLAMWGVDIPKTKYCADHDAPMDWFAAAFFNRVPRAYSMGSRGLSGKTYAMAALGLTAAVVLGVSVTIAAGSTSQTDASLDHMRDMWEHPGAPKYMLDHVTADKQFLTNGAVIQSVTSSERGLRSKHNAWLLVDEIDEWGQGRGSEGIKLLNSAYGMPMEQDNWLGIKMRSQIAGTSTLQNLDGPFQRTIDEMKALDPPEKLYTWCYRESSKTLNNGWLSDQQIEDKKRTVTKDRWEREYELNEVAADHLAIDSDAVEKMFSLGDPSEDDIVSLKGKNYEEFFFESHQAVHDYVISADWARVKDFTVITVWKVTELPATLVYYVRMKHTDWPVQIQKFNKLKRMYRAEGIHDATGLGDVIASMLDDANDIWDFKMTGSQRDDMLSEFILAVERGHLRSPKVDSLYRAIRFATYDDVFGKGAAHHLPDEFCSAALAWRLVVDRYPGHAPIPLPKVEDNWAAKGMAQNAQPQDPLQRLVQSTPAERQQELDQLLGVISSTDQFGTDTAWELMY